LNPPFQSLDLKAPGDSIQLRLREVTQLFNSLDPSPFNEQDLDHDAEEFIVSWARELSHRAKLRLVLHVEKALAGAYADSSVGDAVRHYFSYRASINRLELRQLFKQGRLSLLIGVCFLFSCLSLSNLIHSREGGGPLEDIVRESLTIAGWVAMWRPMEVYLYDWWPLKRRGGLLGRLSRMRVEVRAPAAVP